MILIHLLMLQKVILMAENVILILRRKIFHSLIMEDKYILVESESIAAVICDVICFNFLKKLYLGY